LAQFCTKGMVPLLSSIAPSLPDIVAWQHMNVSSLGFPGQYGIGVHIYGAARSSSAQIINL
jgi:hypothetical protein